METSDVPFSEAVSDAQVADLERLLNATPDEAGLFKALGESLGASATGEDPEERGRAVFRRRLNEVRAAVCGNAVLQDYYSNPNVSDATSIAVSVTGVLVAAHFSGINVVLIAALVARIGLRSICSDAR
jgi:hypothetical protein